MANLLDAQAHEADLERNTIKAITSYFPYEGKKNILEAKRIYSGPKKSINDYKSQKTFLARGRTWGYPLLGDFVLKDKATGKVVGKANKLSLTTIPQITDRYSYIVGGSEYQTDKQWRLKSGVYARRKESGELETQFNLAKGRGFRMLYDPKSRQYKLQYGTANLPMYPVMKALGVSDKAMSAVWGDDILAAQKKKHKDTAIVDIAKRLNKREAANITTPIQAEAAVRKVYGETKLRPETTEITLGKAYDKISGDVLLRSSGKLLNIHRGKETVDNRDSLLFKELWGIEDHIPERILNSKVRVSRRLGNNIDRQTDPKKIISRDTFDVPVRHFFVSTALAQQPSQTNPLDMINGHLRTTMLGPGGISTDRAVTFGAKLIDPSQFGILDPVATPEGKRTGITLHLGIGTGKEGREATMRVYDVKEKKLAVKQAKDLASAVVAFPDNYTWKDGIPTPRSKDITVLRSGDPQPSKAKDVDYILSTPRAMFSLSTNLIPFLPSTQVNRAEMATRHLEQAIPLVAREEPLIQVHSGNRKSNITFERIIGKFTAHTAPVSGTVLSVGKDSMRIKDDAGKTHSVGLYDHYPLNGVKSFVHSTPLVQKGDKVSKGDTVADNTFTKNGVLSLGTNARIAYLPFRGLTFEDGQVISESFAKRLTSTHLYKPSVYLESNMTTGLNKFRAHYPGVVTDANAAKLDDRGTIKVGSTVKPGDVMATVLAKKDPRTDQLMLQGIHKSLARPYSDKSIVWNKPTLGVVTDVVKHGNNVQVFVKTQEEAVVGDKLSGRYGNKGVITAVLPDEEMPHDKEGKPIEMIVNATGVPSRINPSQIHETRLGKVAYATGEPISVVNFEEDDKRKLVKVPGHKRTVHTREGPKRIDVVPYEYERDYGGMVEHELRAHGMKGTEELIDPETGKSLGEVIVGHQYILKLEHQVNKKVSARAAGAGYAYDANLSPKGGGDSGAQRFGSGGLYAMLAHGAVHNIRDGLTYKSDQAQQEVWTAIQEGAPLPTPQPSFAYEKFLGYLNGLGVNVEKNGNNLSLLPLTDEQVLAQSNGKLEHATRVLRGKDLKPEKGGLFDEEITGGPGGKGWSHIELSTPMPNPMFSKPILSLLGLKQADYESVLKGEKSLSKAGAVVAPGEGRTGAPAIVEALSNLNEEQELAKALEDLKTARKGSLDRANKKVKYLKALKAAGLGADEAYVLKNLPVLPPIMRPISALEGGDLSVDGLNLHYREVSLLNDALLQSKGILPEAALAGSSYGLYEAVGGLMGTRPRKVGAVLSDHQTEAPPGIMDIIGGRGGPKFGFYLDKVVDRRQDLTMRSVIVPDIDLSLNEVGLPRTGAMKMFQPFVMRELQSMNMTPLAARQEIENDTPLARKALDIAITKRPVLFKRDPVLFKYGVQAFNVKLHDKKAIHIHPMTVGGFNADFDGDTMSVFVPVSAEAVKEAYTKMMPQTNIFNPGSGRVMYMPSLEGQLGMYLMTQWGKKGNKTYDSLAEAVTDYRKGNISATDVIKAGGKTTTAGRAAVYRALPTNSRDERILTDPKFIMNSKNLGDVMAKVGKGSPSSFSATADRVKELGWGYSHAIGFSFKDEDFRVLTKIRDKHLKIADAKIAKLPSSLSKKDMDAKKVEFFSKATEDMSKDARVELSKKGNALYAMNSAGIKPNWAQVRQILLAPMLLQNAKGEIIPVPVRKSYTEGIDSASYWIASSGARKGLVEKVLAVSEPGALNKQLGNAVMHIAVTDKDCGTDKGISLNTFDSNVVDRFTAKATKLGSKVLPANTQITPDIQSRLQSSGVGKIVVRSPTKCTKAQGICGHCYGVTAGGALLSKGVNIGAISGQSIGERGTQLSMRTFHTGGVATASGGLVGDITRVTQLLKMPSKLPGQATLSDSSGFVSKVSKDVSGGWNVHVGKDLMYVPAALSLKVKKGDKVRKGDPVSSGPINPHHLLKLTDMDRVQRYLADEIYGVYKSEGIQRRNIEVITRGLTNLAKVEDPGDAPGLIRGDYVQIANINAMNTKFKNKVQVTPMLKGLETLALDQTDNWLARLHYRKLKDTLRRGASEGWHSDIHGAHPIPGIAYSAEFGKNTNKGPY